MEEASSRGEKDFEDAERVHKERRTDGKMARR